MRTASKFRSGRVRVRDFDEAQELYHRRGWTDGLPIVPPTEGKVRAMVESVAREPEEVLGAIPVRRRVVTVEKAAINAVMAGCMPAHFPVVLATMEAILSEPFGAHGPTSSTQGAATLLIVNGPAVRELDINCGENLFGQGRRANAVIGRAVRLILVNAAGTVPGRVDRSTLGTPGKFTFCIGEDEELCGRLGWTPLHVERGLDRELSAVTVIATESPHQVNSHLGRRPESVLEAMADTIVSLGTPNAARNQQFVVVIAPEHAHFLAGAGWKKVEVRRYLHARAQRSVADLKRAGRVAGELAPEDHATFRQAAPSPEDILVVAAGGPAGRFSAVLPGWGAPSMTRAVTRAIGACIECH
ncbi:MAG: hypothetical protein ACE5JJ_06450 [Nitrospinota bacterium]